MEARGRARRRVAGVLAMTLGLLLGSSGTGLAAAGLSGTRLASAASSTPALTATFATSSTWAGGYTADFTIKNTGPTTVTGWTLVFSIPVGSSLTSLWNGADSISGRQVTVTPESWNTTLSAGATATVGMEIDGTALYPTACTLDGAVAACTVPKSPGGPTCASLPGKAGPVPFAPYTDVTLYPQINLTNTACASGIRDFTIAFFTGPAAGSGCTPLLAGASYENPTLLADVEQLRKLGGNVVGSFGGEDGQELAQTCSSTTQLESAYQSVVDYYGFNQIDFDIEGAAVDQTTANHRRGAALASLQRDERAAGHPVQVSLTLPVLPQGLPAAEVGVIHSTVGAGVTPNVVNVMTMDYGDGPAPDPAAKMGTYAIDAAKATQLQLAKVFPKDAPAKLWAMVGVTPMIGQNDEQDEVFTLANASQLATWAKSRGVGRLAMWSTTRDVECPGGADQASPMCSGITQSKWAFSAAFGSA